MDRRIHILGGSGSGTTTLGDGLSRELGIRHLDTDAFYWKKTAVPFTEKVAVEDRLDAIHDAISGVDEWVLSGSLCGWGERLIERVTHVVFLWVPWEVRRARLRARSIERHGVDALAVGGEMFRVDRDFMEWASRYDSAGFEQRSRRTHDAWIEALPDRIRVVRVEGEMGVGDVVGRVLDCL